MRVRRVAWRSFRLPFAETFVTAHGPVTAREGVVVRLVADDGLEGLGEASPVTAFGGGTARDVMRLLAELASGLVGLEASEVEALLSRLASQGPGVAAVRCALDTALCDLRARHAGVPVAMLLGGDATRAVPVNAVVGARATEAAVATARSAVDRGFRCVKLKVGVEESLEAEVERVDAVREAIGPTVKLRLDANGAWSVDAAVKVLRRLEPYEIELVEQPVAAQDLAGMARVRRETDIPIAADEAVAGVDRARRVVEAGAADVLVVKPMVAGGPRPAAEIVALARAAGLTAFVTSTVDAGIGVAAALHVAAVLPETAPACGLATGALLVADLVAPSLLVRNGAMALPPGSGLGVTLDEEQMAAYGDEWQEVAG